MRTSKMKKSNVVSVSKSPRLVSVSASTEHWSDCAVNRAPAYEAGPCDCGGLGEQPEQSVAIPKCLYSDGVLH